MSSSIADIILFEFCENMASPTSPKYIDYSASSDATPYTPFRSRLHRRQISNSPPRAAYRASSPGHQSTASAAQIHAKRRSVDSMKELMPLSLSSCTVPPPATPTFGPVSHRTSYQIAPVARRIPARDHTPIPWLNAGLDSYAFDDLAPKKFRETPIYTEPDSPELNRAYFSQDDQELSRTFLDYCNYADTEESYFDSDSDSDSDSESEFSETTTSTSPAMTARFSGSSELSFKCKGVGPSSWLRGTPKSVSVKDLRSVCEEKELFVGKDSRVEHWMESDESRSSSPESFVELYEAIVTPLTPAKPHIVGVKSLEKHHVVPPRMSSLSARAATLDAKTHRRMTSYSMSLPVLESPSQQSQGYSSLTKSAISSHFMDNCSMSPNRLASKYPLSATRISSEILALPLVEAICDSICGGTQDLHLDTYCISEIRRVNKSTQSTLVVQQRQHQRPSSRMTEKASTSSLRLRARSKSIFSLSRLPKRSETPPPAYMQRCVPQSENVLHNKPNIEPLRAVFPEAEDHYLQVLYAHLLAYNYVYSLSQKLVSSRKISRKLGLPHSPTLPDFGFNGGGSFMQDLDEKENMMTRLDDDDDGGFDIILRELAVCTQGILDSMEGYEIARKRVGEGDEVDWAVIRTLAEVVKGCESGFRKN